MKKRTKGEWLCDIGALPALSVMTFYGCLRENPIISSLTIPLAIITLPLLPFYLAGEKILHECNKEDFDRETKHLPRIDSRPKEYAAIDCHSDDSAKILDLSPHFIEHLSSLNDLNFHSYDEAKQWLLNHGFYEVVINEEYNYMYGTYWVKKKVEILDE